MLVLNLLMDRPLNLVVSSGQASDGPTGMSRLSSGALHEDRTFEPGASRLQSERSETGKTT